MSHWYSLISTGSKSRAWYATIKKTEGRKKGIEGIGQRNGRLPGLVFVAHQRDSNKEAIELRKFRVARVVGWPSSYSLNIYIYIYICMIYTANSSYETLCIYIYIHMRVSLLHTIYRYVSYIWFTRQHAHTGVYIYFYGGIFFGFTLSLSPLCLVHSEQVPCNDMMHSP